MAKNVTAMSVLIGTVERPFADEWGESWYNVKSFGAVGDGDHDDTDNIQAAFDAAFLSAGSPKAADDNVTLFFPNGDYVTTDTINWTARSCTLRGCGKHATRIRNATPGSTVLKTPGGLQYASIYDMSFVSAGGAGSICFDWFSDNTLNRFNLTFINCAFLGAEIGVNLGAPPEIPLASETLWVCCDFTGTLYGVVTRQQQNSLNHMFVGGSVGGSVNVGIHMNVGSAPLISSVRFSGASIGSFPSDVQNTSGNGVYMVGCTSTSPGSFLTTDPNPGSVMVGCYHNSSGGDIVRTGNGAVLDGCYATSSIVRKSGSFAGTIYLRCCQFDNSGYLTTAWLPSGSIGEDI